MKRLRAFADAIATVLAREGVPGVRAHGVYVPYAYPGSLAPLREDESLGWLAARMDEESARYLEWAEIAAGFAADLARYRRGDPREPDRPRFDQQWFSGLDAAIAYAMVRSLAPARVVEVGSGHSTRFLARAATDGATGTRLHSIDPVPRRDIDRLCDEVTRASVTRVAPELFDALGPGDVLFVDGSHALLPGSDVDYLFARVLPRLRAGVVVHVHDVFLPYGYPAAWARRAYTEQSLVAALLAGGGRFRILWPAAWMRRRHGGALAAIEAPLCPGALESSFWMRVGEEGGATPAPGEGRRD